MRDRNAHRAGNQLVEVSSLTTNHGHAAKGDNAVTGASCAAFHLPCETMATLRRALAGFDDAVFFAEEFQAHGKPPQVAHVL
jgi:hypothetical protein